MGQRSHQRNGRQHREDAKTSHRRTSSDAIGERTEYRLQEHEGKERGGHDPAGGSRVHAGGIHEILLHVRRVGVEDERASCGEAEHDEERSLVLPETSHRAGTRRPARVRGRGLDERAPEKERHERSDRADHKRNSPAPRVQLRRRQELLQDDEDQHREQLTPNQRDVLKCRVKSPASGNGDFAHVSRARAVLSADGESLYETRHQQEHGSGRPDCRVGRQHRYHQRAGAHRQDGNHHRRAAAGLGRRSARTASPRAGGRGNLRQRFRRCSAAARCDRRRERTPRRSTAT